LAALLAQDGYQVEVARDGVEALAQLAASPPPDTIVTELTFRVGDGASVVRSARARLPRLRVVVLTRYANSVVPSQFGEPLPTVLTKPLDYERLLSVLAGQGSGDEAREALRASPRI
jgi:CheY-like chemotaxis protein